MTRLIDADALKKAMDGYWGRCQRIRKPRNGETAVFLDVMATVKNQPTVDAVPVKHGKFIGTEYDGYADGSPVYYEWKCSECGCIFEDDEPTYNYCPNCGARMVEDE